MLGKAKVNRSLLIKTIMLSVLVSVSAASRGLPNENFLSPEGVFVGMTGPEARTTLEEKGFALQPSGCLFQRLNSTTAAARSNDKTEVRLTLINLDKTGSGPRTTEDLIASREKIKTCGDENYVVSEITWKDWQPRAQPVDPKADVNALIAEFGQFKTCTIQQDHEYRWCRWHGLPQAPKVDEILFTSKKGGYREITVKAIEARIRPMDEERAANIEPMRLQALTVCENYNLGGGADLFRALKDCSCIADKVAEGYGTGQIDSVDVQAINKFDDNCPASLEALQSHFRKECFSNYNNPNLPYAAWAKSGGCDCYAEHAAKAFEADPRASFPHISGIGSSALVACDFASADEIAAEAQVVQAASLPDAPDGLRPLATPLFNGIPIAYRAAGGRIADPIRGDVGTEEFHRYVNLLLIQKEPALLESDALLRFLAGQNLALEDRDRLLSGCTDRNANYCVWAGTNEFEKRRNTEEFKNGAAKRLPELANQLSSKLMVVEQLRMGDYESVRGGFPLASLAGTHKKYRLFNGYWGETPGLAAVHPADRPTPQLWKLDPKQSEALADHLLSKGLRSGQQRMVYFAWTYELGEMSPDTSWGPDHREIQVTPIKAMITSDVELSDVLVDYVPGTSDTITAGFRTSARTESTIADDDEGAQVAARSDPIEAATENHSETSGALVSNEKVAARKTAIAVRPFEPSLIGNSYDYPLSRMSVRPGEKLRLINLLLIAARPDEAHSDGNAMFLAHQNLIGLTDPTGKWLGQSEFERLASEQTYKDAGASEVLEMGIKLPAQLRVTLSVPLTEYNFETEAFPYLGNAYGQTVQGETNNEVMLHPWTKSIVGQKPVIARLSNGGYPSELKLPVAEAEAVSNLLGARRRQVFISTVIELTSLHQENFWVFDGTIQSMAFYADDNLTQPIKEIVPGTTP